MTKKEMYTNIINLVENGNCDATFGEIVEFCNHEITLLDKKTSTQRKPTATQVENETFKAMIVEFLSTADGTKSIKDMQTEVETLAPLSNQRITHLLTDLVKAGTLTKDYIKKTPYYAIAG